MSSTCNCSDNTCSHNTHEKCGHCDAILDLNWWSQTFNFKFDPKSCVCNGKISLCLPCSSHLMGQKCCSHQIDTFFKGGDIKLCTDHLTGSQVIHKSADNLPQ